MRICISFGILFFVGCALSGVQSTRIIRLLPNCVTVARLPLEQFVEVRILIRQPEIKTPECYSGVFLFSAVLSASKQPEQVLLCKCKAEFSLEFNGTDVVFKDLAERHPAVCEHPVDHMDFKSSPDLASAEFRKNLQQSDAAFCMNISFCWQELYLALYDKSFLSGYHCNQLYMADFDGQYDISKNKHTKTKIICSFRLIYKTDAFFLCKMPAVS